MWSKLADHSCLLDNFRLEKGILNSLNIVFIIDVFSYSELSKGLLSFGGKCSNVPFLIHGLIATTGILIPNLLNLNPFLLTLSSGEGMFISGGGTWS